MPFLLPNQQRQSNEVLTQAGENHPLSIILLDIPTPDGKHNKLPLCQLSYLSVNSQQYMSTLMSQDMVT